MGLFRKRNKVDEAEKVSETQFMKELTSNRKCRDIVCIPVFLAYWCGMLFVLYVALQKGDPARLLFGTDYLGNICGASSEADQSSCYANSTCGIFVAYPRLDEDIYLAQKNGYLDTPLGILDYPFHGVCRSSCPEGLEDVNGDGEEDNWVCNYDVMATLNVLYGENPSSSEIPSDQARVALEECLEEKNNVPFMTGYSRLPRSKILSTGIEADCLELMTGCWKIYSEETSLFFRCIPLVADNSTCTVSPYLVSVNQSVAVIEKEDGSVSPRPGSDPHCGVCLEPEKDENGNPMDPGSSLCKAKKVFSTVEHTQSVANPLFSAVSTFSQEIQNWLGDVLNTYPQIALCGAVVPFLLGIVWLIFLRLAAKTFVFTVLYGLLVFLGFLTLQFMIYGGVITTEFLDDIINKVGNATGIDIDSESISSTITGVDLFESASSSTDTYEILGWVMFSVTIIYFLLLLALAKRIKIAVAIIREATIAISSMPLILFFPSFTVAATLALSGGISYLCLYIVSMRDIETLDSVTILNGSTTTLKSYATAVGLSDAGEAEDLIENITDQAFAKFNGLPTMEIFLAYALLGYFWTNELVEAIGATTIAGAIGSWYWSTYENNKKSKSLPKRPVIKSVYRVFRYHIGSLLFGSFIIALIQLVRAILMYIDKKTQRLQKKNRAIRILLKAVQCCLFVLEKCLKFLTKNAYIYIALFGKSFCTSTKEVFSLLLKNFLRIGTATVISGLIIGLGRVLIVCVSCFLCITVLTFSGEGLFGDALAAFNLDSGQTIAPTSVVPPVIVTAFLSWFVSGCFMGVYGLTIDTILISFCVDEEKNDGSAQKPYYMTKSLKKLTRKLNKKDKKVHADSSGADSKDSSGKSKQTF
eukprot:snap_masked-scaffold_4-processed-gene-18.36-mRNA-1 protein AED:0.33 eAED:0.33 QI:0/0/0/1/1/1/2/0/869